MDAWVLIALRLGLYLGLGLLVGMPLYRLLVTHDGRAFARGLIAALAVAGIMLSGLWLLACATAMGGSPDWPTISLLLFETAMGWALMLRLTALALILLLPPRPTLLALPAAVAMATLAWTGHAAATEGIWGKLHLASDVLHMLAAAIWLGALVRFVSNVARRETDIVAELSRFAWPGTAIVGVLIVTGVYNMTMIVGFELFQTPILSPYGQLLAAKILLFAAMLGLAAANRWLFTPAVRSGAPITGIRISLIVETCFWISIIGIVAIMGTLDPLG